MIPLLLPVNVLLGYFINLSVWFCLCLNFFIAVLLQASSPNWRHTVLLRLKTFTSMVSKNIVNVLWIYHKWLANFIHLDFWISKENQKLAQEEQQRRDPSSWKDIHNWRQFETAIVYCIHAIKHICFLVGFSFLNICTGVFVKLSQITVDQHYIHFELKYNFECNRKTMCYLICFCVYCSKVVLWVLFPVRGNVSKIKIDNLYLYLLQHNLLALWYKT